MKLGFLYNSGLEYWQFWEMEFSAVVPFTTWDQKSLIRFSSMGLFVPIISTSFYYLLGLYVFFIYRKEIGRFARRNSHLTVHLLNVEFFIIMINYIGESMGTWWKGIIPWWCISFALSPQRALDKEHQKKLLIFSHFIYSMWFIHMNDQTGHSYSHDKLLALHLKEVEYENLDPTLDPSSKEKAQRQWCYAAVIWKSHNANKRIPSDT